jgi:hypothetical protein
MVQADAPVAGTFSSSNPLYNRIWSLVRWAQRSNMGPVMTDCPTREKLGWLEEDHLNGPALRYNFDMGTVFSKTMNDMADAQEEGGFVPNIAPEYVKFGGSGDGNPFRNSPEWGSSFILVAWQQYLFTGNTDLLTRHYEGMKKYVAYLQSKAQGHILDFGLGDWFDIGPKRPGPSQLTPRPLTATAIYYEDVTVMAKIARLVGKEGDAKQYKALGEKIRAAFNAKFFNSTTGTYSTNSQTANAMPLVLGLVDRRHRRTVIDAIVKDVRKNGKGLTAGDVGYRYLLRALAEGGRSDVIFEMNNQSEKPGYGMQLARGATSLTEAWDASPHASMNHFMLGQINEWFYHDLAGIQSDPTAPGFRKIIIRPTPVGDLNDVRARYDSSAGNIASHWHKSGDEFNLDLTVPPNTTATVHLPASALKSVMEGGRKIRSVPGIKVIGKGSGEVLLEVGSGTYQFQTTVADRK